jgi:Domain of unknown function (DUF4911)
LVQEVIMTKKDDLEPRHSIRKKIRVRKEDSAFIYFILESYEGITSYSTLDFKQGDPFRDLELRIPPDFLLEVEDLLKRFGDIVYEI